GWPIPVGQRFWIDQGRFLYEWWIVWLFHAILFSFLMVAAACDLAGREIPLPLTLTGTLVGLIWSVFLPWPWPWNATQALPQARPGIPAWMVWPDPESGLKAGAYP